jgi:hypothetical protein
MSSDPRSATERRPALLPFALFFGLAVGVTEAGAWDVRRFAFDAITSLSPHIVWMAPLVYAVLLVMLALGLLGIERVARRRLPPGAAIFIIALPAIVALLLLVPRLHMGAVLILATGIAYQFQRSVQLSPATWTRVARTGAATLGVVIAVATAFVIAAPAVTERRAQAALPEAREDAPNVLFLILDTVRAASLGLYGHARETTP